MLLGADNLVTGNRPSRTNIQEEVQCTTEKLSPPARKLRPRGD